MGSSTSLETDYNDNLCPPPSATSCSSSSSSSPLLPPNSLPPPSSSSYRTAPWSVAALTSPLSQSLDATMTSDFLKRARPHCQHSLHPRKHSLDFHLRPLADADIRSGVHRSATVSSYQVPRPASTPQPPLRPSSTPSVDSLTQEEIHASLPTFPPPPRPPKPPAITLFGDGSSDGVGPATLPRTNSETERRDECTIRAGHLIKGNIAITCRTSKITKFVIYHLCIGQQSRGTGICVQSSHSHSQNTEPTLNKISIHPFPGYCTESKSGHMTSEVR